MVIKAITDKNGIVIKPNKDQVTAAQETPKAQEAAS